MNAQAQGLAETVAERLRQLAQTVEAEGAREVLNLRANVKAILRGPDGEVKDTRDFHNLICTAGKNALLAATGGKAVDAFDYICIGTGSTAADAGDTALGNESARAQGTTTNPTASSWKVTYTFPAGTGTGAITESALDSGAVASAAILCRQVFAAINKGASDTLQIDWTIT